MPVHINVQLFKPSGKWKYDREIEIPEDTSSYHLTSALNKELYSETEYQWQVHVHPDLQHTPEAAELVGFPRLFTVYNPDVERGSWA